MASTNEDGNTSGRRTRSGKKVSIPQPLTPSTRTTRRSQKKPKDEVIVIEAEPECEVISNEIEDEVQTAAPIPHQSDVIKEMLAEAAQGVIIDDGGDGGDAGADSDVIEIPDTDIGDGEELVEEVIKEDYDDCIIYEEEQIEETDDIEMYTIQEEQTEAVNETPLNTAHSSTTAIDEKSSSFPFGTVIQSETSEEVQNEEEVEEENNDDVGSGGIAESSLLASLAGDNANSLPSVGGGEEAENKKDEFSMRNEDPKETELEKMESDDSLSDPAIAEDIERDAVDASNATIVNTEMVSEDELPMPTKPEINDAEEVSDEELPAPQRAELPADAEVISEDELPAAASVEKKSPTALPKTPNSGAKRKADSDGENDPTDNSSPNEKTQSRADDAVKDTKSEQYNPMSPTSESNDGLQPLEKKAKIEEDESCTDDIEKKKESKEKEKEKKKLPDLDKYWRSVKEDPTDFTGWTYLLQYVDNESDAEAAREAYDAFLSHYPYCYGYWRKYADYEKRKGVKANCNTVFERGLQAIPLSVDLWIHYLSHVKSNSNNTADEEFIRAQFERAINACGLEFRSDKLWDAYIKWEHDNKRFHRIVEIYDRLLAIPTQGYSGHFDNFQDLITQHSITATITADELIKIRTELRESCASRYAKSKERRATSKEKDHKESSKVSDKEKEHKESKSSSDKEKDKDAKESKEESSGDTKGYSKQDANDTTKETDPDAAAAADSPPKDEKVSIKEINVNDLSTISESELSSIKDKVISIRRKLHKNTIAAVTARWTFEEGIKRPYFHVKPLERCQLKNWKDYLEFEIEKGDRKRILVLFERCLIACALYEEFWLKMIRYLEAIMEEPNIPEIASDVYRRACEIHHRDKPGLHLLWAAFEEIHNNPDKAASILADIDKKCPNLLQVAYRRINLERRRGNYSKCKELYEHYIATAKNKSLAGSVAIKYARFLHKICHDIDAAVIMLRQTLEKDAGNARVALQLIDLSIQRPKVDEEEVVSIIDKFMARENIDPEQKAMFAQRKVEFLEDFCKSAKRLQNAQRDMQYAMAKANEAKKKRESSPSRKSSSAMNKDGVLGSTSMAQSTAYNNGANTTGAYNYNSAYYSQQNSGSYQQSYDSYYNQWQYGSGSGYGGYGQWSGYGSYY